MVGTVCTALIFGHMGPEYRGRPLYCPRPPTSPGRRFSPYFCEPVIAGLDENNKPHLSGMDLLGAQVGPRPASPFPWPRLLLLLRIRIRPNTTTLPTTRQVFTDDFIVAGDCTEAASS